MISCDLQILKPERGMKHMTNQRTIRTAFTLIEVLVVITILSILTALAIPRLRVVNKERGMREASRVVASSFAQASQRAVNEGVSGVLLRRNPYRAVIEPSESCPGLPR